MGLKKFSVFLLAEGSGDAPIFLGNEGTNFGFAVTDEAEGN